ncbi:DUF4352 domain-containing protein [Paenibacillus sp. HJGM_3]|uniref:DUF4352 domain-containing protein n=1 Tax=Paenibacillus sp. HJGM_3 TaxID=3379816 RepID=UPI00385DF2FC
MKKKLMLVLAGAAISVSSMSIGAYAASNLEEISAYLNKGLKITLNGKAWTPKDADGNVVYPITYDGTTYLPVRAAGEALGLKVGYDAATETVLLGETPSAKGSSRQNPAVKGDTILFAQKNFMDDIEGTVKLQEVVRGDQAWKTIQAANKFNSAPKEGNEYILAKVEIKITKNAKQDAAVDINPTLFEAISADGKKYDNFISVVVPDPSIDTDLYVGAIHSGWIAFEVSKTDTAPLMAVTRNYDGTGGAWFKLQ